MNNDEGEEKMKEIISKIKADVIAVSVAILLVFTIFSSVFVLTADSLEPNNLYEDETLKLDSQEDGYHIKKLTSNVFLEIYNQIFPVDYATKNFSFISGNEKLVLRIDHTGLPYAAIEQIRLTKENVIIPIDSACFVETNKDIEEDLIEKDLDVVVAHQQTIEIIWDLTDQPEGFFTMEMTANEYGRGDPLSWNGGMYILGSNYGSPKIDGKLDDFTKSPIYSPIWRPDSGHPDGVTNVYICDDENNVYFGFDITCDNTNDIGEDWFKLIIGEMDFYVDDFDEEYGIMNFRNTESVSYKHQVVEMSIPKNVLNDKVIEDFEKPLL